MLDSIPDDLIVQWRKAFGVAEPIFGASLDAIGTLNGQKIVCVGPTRLGLYDTADGELRWYSMFDFESVFRTDDGFGTYLLDRPIPAHYEVDDDFAETVVATYARVEQHRRTAPKRSGFAYRLERLAVLLFRFLGAICGIVGFVLTSLALAVLDGFGLQLTGDTRGGVLIAGAVVGWFGLRALILMWLEKRGYRWA